MDQQYQNIMGLLGMDEEKVRQQQLQSGLLSAGLQLLAGSGYSPVRRTTGELLGQAGAAGMQGYQQAGESAIDRAIKGMQVQQMVQKQREAQRLQQLGSQLVQPQKAMVPSTDAEAQEGGFYGQQGVNVLPTRMGMNQDVVRQLMTTPAGMDYLSNVVKTQRELAGKTEVIEIYSPSGQAMKVRYNVDTGEYTPIGNAKAEPFVQVDRGNVIELRSPSGNIIGSLPKGAAPTAPSFTMTDAGQILNTRTGQVTTPTDAQGNPIIVDQSAKATEGERLSSGFYMRMADASNTFRQPLKSPDGKPITRGDKVLTLEDVASKPEVFAEVVGGLIPDWLGGKAAQQFATSPLREQYEQAQENWVTANLRKESGAVIGPEEMKKEIRKWFPVVGNSAEVIEQKRKARQVAEESMRKNAGRALSVQSKQRNVTVDY
jgi:hypothetical protein